MSMSPTTPRRRARAAPAVVSPTKPAAADPTPAPEELHERSIFDPKWQRWAHRNTNYRDDETISFM